MPFQIELADETAEEIDAAFSWYLERSPSTAESFLRELDRALALILEAPDIWPEFEGGQRYLLHRFPFSIIYRLAESSVTVIAIAHQSRRPGYWRER